MHRARALAGTAVLVLAGAECPGVAAAEDGAHAMMAPKDRKSGPAPPALPKGAKVAVLLGDPGKSGHFVLRLRVPTGYRLAPHGHSQHAELTVICVMFCLGLGDSVAARHARPLPAGGLHYPRAKEHHDACAKGSEGRPG